MPVAPPRPKGPSLNTLRAFEAAARLGGFTAAADELCVSPGAVAQQVKALEAWAGADLFERHARGVLLTRIGSDVQAEFETAFDRMGDAVQALRMAASPRHIRIAALPSVAQLWLSPRLPALRADIPDISISVTAMEIRPNLLREPFDLSLFFDDGPTAGDRIAVCTDTMFPVCSPAVASALNTPEDLSGQTLLFDALWEEDWPRWLAAANAGSVPVGNGPVFSLYSLAVAEAQNGAGVLIGHEPLVRDHLAAGTLVEPFDFRLPLDRRLTLEQSASARKNRYVRRVVDLLRDVETGN